MNRRMGFVLPTVVVSSVVLMIVLMAALNLASSSSAALRDQYYNMLAREAAEAGAVMMGECLKARDFDAVKIVRPNTDCKGIPNGAQTAIYSSGNLQTTFEGRYIIAGRSQTVSIAGKAQLKRSDGVVYKEYKYTSKQTVTDSLDHNGSTGSKRWWYLGHNASLDFGVNGSHPVASTLGNRAFASQEGVTTVSDRNGNLLFFSDGLNIWDKSGRVMPVKSGSINANPNCDATSGSFNFGNTSLGQRLCGSTTATQAVAAFPINQEETRYVVVTNTANQGEAKKYGTLYWSLIDFTPAKPDGEIILRNYAVAPLHMKNYASEALNARPNEKGNGAIIYTYRQNAPNKLYAFGLWSENNGSHIISGQNPNNSGNTKNIIFSEQEFTGSPPSRTRACGNHAAAFSSTGFGSVNFDSSYSKMVVFMGSNGQCHDNNDNNDSYREGKWTNAGIIKVFDIRGDHVISETNGWTVEKPLENRGAAYSADFSPSGRYVYTASIYPARIYRYDLHAGSNYNIKQSERFIGNSGCSDYHGTGIRGTRCLITSNGLAGTGPEGGGQILRGPDGRMYVADRGTKHISVIDHPDADSPAVHAQTATAVGWRYAGLPIPGGGYSFYGLPQMVTLYSPRLIQY